MVEYSPFWFAVLIIGVVLISMAILFGLKIVYSAIDSNGNIIPDQKPDLKCVEFSDGTLTVIQFSSRGGCGADSGAMNTISYLLKKGYHIDAVVPTADQGNSMMDLGVVFMSR